MESDKLMKRSKKMNTRIKKETTVEANHRKDKEMEKDCLINLFLLLTMTIH
jgi:hypothetical protein